MSQCMEEMVPSLTGFYGKPIGKSQVRPPLRTTSSH